MLEASVLVSNRLGLHARAAAKLVSLAKSFDASITVSDQTGTRMADAASILDILALAASFGTRLTITAEGTEEADAIEAVTRLFHDKFGED